MLKSGFVVRFFIIALLLLCFPRYALAEVGPKNGDTWVPVLPSHAQTQPGVDNLTVTDIVVDQTASNSVMARDQAIAEAPKLAFQKLAERNLSPEAAKALKPPKDLQSLVADFEIKDEHMSSTRYVAKFTVRFADAVRSFIDVKPFGPPAPIQAPALSGQPLPGQTNPAQAVPGATGLPPLPSSAEGGGAAYQPEEEAALGKRVLILPYFENLAGQTLLWEDPNPWRRIWQNAMPKSPPGEQQFIVPLGDISDIAAGPSNGVWSGSYAAVEKLRAHYHADDVVLLAANKSGSIMTVDIYAYRDGALKHRGSITPYAEGMPDEEAFRSAMQGSLKVLREGNGAVRSAPSIETISRDAVRGATGVVTPKTAVQAYPIPPASYNPPAPPYTTTQVYPAPRGSAPPPQFSSAPPAQYSNMPPAQYSNMPPVQYSSAAPTQYAPAAGTPNMAPGRGQLQATVSFPSFQGWMEMQKRLNSLAPAVGVDIRSLTSNGAEVTLTYDGSFETLRGALAARGISLGGPPPVTSSGAATALYNLRLLN
jgi:hypothetical protein